MDPEYSSYLVARGHLEKKRENFELSRHYFDKCLQLYPNDARAIYYRSNLYRRMRVHCAFRRELTRCTEKAPTFYQAFRLLSKVESAFGNQERAINLLVRASELNPYNGSMLNDIGIMYDDEENYE